MGRDLFSPSVDRRCFLGGAAAIGAALAITGPAIAQPSTGPGLAFEAARSGRVFGAAVRTDQVGRGGDLRQIALRDCSLFTPEIGLQWNAIEPSPGQLAFAKMDDLTALAAATGQKVVGHSLLWHLGAPAWVESALSDQKTWAPIHRHFASVLPRFSDAIGLWNVVNEPIDIGLRPDGLRRNVFLEAFGPEYINRALEDARDLTPKTHLMINEYGLEYDYPVERARRTAFLKLIERLRATNAPLDVIGLQAHLDLGKGQVSQSEIRSFVHELSDMGLSIMVTELDVKESDYVAPASVRDQRVADETRRYLDAVLDEPAVKGVTTWGLSDRHSWLEVTAADYKRFPGAWGRPGEGPGLNRGLPYDSDLRPKPMYDAITRAFQGARRAQAA